MSGPHVDTPAPGRPPPPPPGWYGDPARQAVLRWWDGRAWSSWVSDGGPVATSPMPADAAPAAWGRHPALRVAWPARAALVALAGALVGVFLAGVGALVGDAVAATDALVIALAQGGLAAGLLGACWWASRWYGTGRLGADLGVRLTALDAAIGLGLSWVARVLGVLVALPFVLLDRRFAGSNLEGVDDLVDDPAALLALLVAGVVVAPVVEEMFFRGLLQGALEPVLRPAGAIAVQAVVFGLAHVGVALGPANVSVVAVTATAGAVFGVAAWWTRRLGASMVAHAGFNVVGLIVAIALAA